MKMTCADCRELTEFEPEVFEGEATGDYTCKSCGWMQRSFAEGKIELADNVLSNLERVLVLAGLSSELEEVRVVREILNIPAQ